MSFETLGTVLLTESSRRNLDELHALIHWESEGYHVVGKTEDGPQTVKMAEELSPDLLILSHRLKGLSGVEVLRQIRKCCPGTQVILLCEYADFSIAQQAVRYGISGLLLKPLEPEDLLGAVRHLENTRISPVQGQEPWNWARAWEKRLRNSPIYGDGIQKLAIAASFEVQLENGAHVIRLPADGSEILVAAMDDTTSTLLDTLQGLHRRVGVSCPFQDASELERAVFQARLAASPFWSREKRLVQCCCENNYEAIYLFRQLWFLLYQCVAVQEYSMHQFWALYDILLNMVQSLKMDFREIIAIHNGLVLMAKSIDINAGAGLQYLSVYEINSWSEEKNSLEYSLVRIRRDMQDHLRAGKFDVNMHPLGEFINEIIIYLDAHFCEKGISVENVAAKFYMTPAYFGQTFKRIYGISITEHINRKRIDYAEYLLTHENITIKDVANQVGIADYFYFSKLFKKYKGITPGEARKGIRPGE